MPRKNVNVNVVNQNVVHQHDYQNRNHKGRIIRRIIINDNYENRNTQKFVLVVVLCHHCFSVMFFIK
jgi:hypothetical protein